MRLILFILLFLVPLKSDGDANIIKVLQINSKWNKANNVDLSKLKGCKVDFGWYEDQSPEAKSVIKKLPVIILYSNKKPVYKWEADISFKLNVSIEEVQRKINNIK